MGKRILLINGHPDRKSFNHALSAAYVDGASASGAEIRQLSLGELKFDPSLKNGYRPILALEPDLVRAQEWIQWAEHVVFVYPIWWTDMPALLKGFLDRILLPGYAYRRKAGFTYEKLLQGRSARLLITMDSPPWYYKTVMRGAGITVMKRGTLEFCGIRPVRTTLIGPVKSSSPERRQQWLKQTEALGRKQQ